MHNAFLQRSKAKLAIAKLLGFLDRRIRRELQEATFVELWEVRRTYHKRIKELASLDSTYKNPSMGSRTRADREHPFRKYLDEEDWRRDSEQEGEDPLAYWGPTHDKLRDDECVEFFTWKHKEHFWDTDYDKCIRAWRREMGRILPVMPKSGSLPTNTNVRRTSNNRERGRHTGDPTSTDKARAAKAPVGESEGQVFLSLEDCEIH
jgi:hypothetical protein